MKEQLKVGGIGNKKLLRDWKGFLDYLKNGTMAIDSLGKRNNLLKLS